jgi:hypothetical protein
MLIVSSLGGLGGGNCRIPRDRVTVRSAFCRLRSVPTTIKGEEEEYETAMIDETPLIKQRTSGAGQGQAKWMQCAVKRCRLPVANCRFQAGPRWAIAKFTEQARPRRYPPRRPHQDHIPGLMRGAQGSRSRQAPALWVPD